MSTPRIDRLDQNVVINGGLHYWQRGTTFNAIPASTYFADRFRYNKVGAQIVNITRSTDVPALTGMVPASAIQVAVATANASPASGDYSSILHIIEHSFMNQLIGNDVTLLLSVKSPKVGKHYVTVVTAFGSNAIHLSYNISTANVYQRVALNFQLPPGYTYLSGSGAGLILHFPLMVGAGLTSVSENTWVAAGNLAGPGMQNLLDSTSNVFKVTGIELVQGTFNTDKAFSIAGRTLPGEQSLCERFYQVLNLGIGTPLVDYYAAAANTYYTTRSWTFPAMRAFPIISHTNNFSAQNLEAAVAFSYMSNREIVMMARAAAVGRTFVFSNSPNGSSIYLESEY